MCDITEEINLPNLDYLASLGKSANYYYMSSSQFLVCKDHYRKKWKIAEKLKFWMPLAACWISVILIAMLMTIFVPTIYNNIFLKWVVYLTVGGIAFFITDSYFGSLSNYYLDELNTMIDVRDTKRQ